jgi:hypothetical protein
MSVPAKEDSHLSKVSQVPVRGYLLGAKGYQISKTKENCLPVQENPTLIKVNQQG